jgi:hypothetical protein
VIATARSKQAYEQTDQDGKKKVVKLGMSPTIRDGTEYEFALHFDLNEAHKAEPKKDNTRKFGDASKLWDLCDGSVASELRDWMESATPVERPTPETLAAMDAAIAALPQQKQGAARKRWAQRRDQGVSEADAQQMLGVLTAKSEPMSLAHAQAPEGAAV